MVYNPILDRNDFLRERTVIIEEINRTHDNPKFELEERIYELIYGKNTQYGYPIPGFIKDIEKIEYKLGYPVKTTIVQTTLSRDEF